MFQSNRAVAQRLRRLPRAHLGQNLLVILMALFDLALLRIVQSVTKIRRRKIRDAGHGALFDLATQPRGSRVVP